MGPRDFFLAAAVSYVDQVRAIPDGAWAGPGLGGWDLRALVGHTCRSLVTVVDYSGRTAETVEVESAAAYFRRAAQLSPEQREAVFQRGLDAGAGLGEHPLHFVEEALSAAGEALDRTPPDRLVVSAMGAMRFEEYLRTRSFELVVHGLDIARATGADRYEPPAEALADAVQVAAATAVEGGHGVTLLLALTGRGGLPGGFSVV